MVKAPINAGVAATLAKTQGSIGYIDFGFSSLTNLQIAALENKAGVYISPGLEGGQAALANAHIPENMIVWLSDPEGRDSYPITTFTWMLFYKKYDDPEKAALLRDMINFCLEKGQKLSQRVGYIPLPANVIERVRAAAANIQ
jgi:phosphate transport system substrate-binding protein